MTAAALRAESLAQLAGAGASGPAPAAVGQKFTADGAVLPFPGNTFIRHIPAGPAHAALTEAARRLQDGPLAGAFSFLPPASFHMTVFEGVTDRDRSGGRWPAGMDPDAPVEAVTEAFLPKVRALDLPPAVRIRTLGIFGGYSVRVDGATEADTRALWHTREVLSAATGIRRADFASYRFHITLAYPLRWLTPEEAVRVMDLSDAVAADLIAAAPEIALGAVEFCRFDDMHAFPLIARLG